MKLIREQALSFDDVLLVPQYSDIKSRKEVSLQSGILDFPVIASPMNTVCEDQMAIALGQYGGLGVIHRYLSIEKQTQIVDRVRSALGPEKTVAAAIGVTDDWLNRAKELVMAGADCLCFDVAHGFHLNLKDAIENVEFQKLLFNHEIILMAGNVATFEGFRFLEELGVQIVRTNVGSGSICKTKIQTHHGIPTLQTILDIQKGYKDHDVYLSGRKAWLIADGGIKTSGDAVCALAAGADYLKLKRS